MATAIHLVLSTSMQRPVAFPPTIYAFKRRSCPEAFPRHNAPPCHACLSTFFRTIHWVSQRVRTATNGRHIASVQRAMSGNTIFPDGERSFSLEHLQNKLVCTGNNAPVNDLKHHATTFFKLFNDVRSIKRQPQYLPKPAYLLYLPRNHVVCPAARRLYSTSDAKF